MFISSNSIFSYRKQFRNWIQILYRIVRNEYPFEAVTRENRRFKIYGHSQIYFLLKGVEPPEYFPVENLMKIKFNDRVLSFINALQNGEIFELFVEETYAPLDVMNSTVIDVGGNIGDSAIYFALKGAKSVVSIEPQLKSYESMVKNVSLNTLDGIIIPVRAGVGKEESFSTVKSNNESPDGGTSLKSFKEGEKIHIIDMKYIVDNYLTERNVLKVDCEGCEYDFFERISRENMQRFHQIMVETHYGSKKIIMKLQSVGFETSYVPGMIGYNTNSKPHIMSTGIVLAKLREDSINNQT